MQEQGEINDREEDTYEAWYKENESLLEYAFYQAIPLEDQPLDDDIDEYMQLHADEFEEFCKESFNLDVRLGLI